MNITIYSSDIRDLDEVIERQFNIAHYYGTSLFNEDGNLRPQDEYEYHIEPHTYLAVIMDMQEQINDLHKTLMQLKEQANG